MDTNNIDNSSKHNVGSQQKFSTPLMSANTLSQKSSNNKPRIKKYILIAIVAIIAIAGLIVIVSFIFKKNDPEIVNNTSKWKNYQLEDKTFSVLYPYKPEEVKAQHSSSATSKTYRAKSSDDKNSYEVVIGEHIANKLSAREVLDAYIRGVERETETRKFIQTTDKKYFEFNGKQAVEYKQSYEHENEKLVTRARIIVEDNKIYVIQTFGSNREAANSSIFIDSFKFI